MTARHPLRHGTSRRRAPGDRRPRPEGHAAQARSADRAKPISASGAGGAAPQPEAARTGAWRRLGELAPSLAKVYERLALLAARAGPLEPQQSALLKVALSVGRGSWRGTHAHARKALETGVSAEALRQVACLALPVLGLAAALDALRWIEEIIDEHARGA